MNFINSLISIFRISGFTGFTLENFIMMLVASALLYFAIVKKYEPLSLPLVLF